MLAAPSVPLAPLEGVGTMRCDGHGLMQAPFVLRALELLRENPVEGVVVTRPFMETPDSRRYIKHLEYLQGKEHRVLAVLGYYVAEVGKVRTEDGRLMSLPPIGRYSAVYKTKSDARAIFNFQFLNSIGCTIGIKAHIAGGGRFIDRLRAHEPATGRWVILHADVKNAYYGIPAGDKLSQASCVRVGNKILRAMVLCMGWAHSCGICQALTWGVIGARSKKQVDLGFPQEWGPEMPAVVELDGGGWIVVVIDSIFMMLPEREATEHQAAEWRRLQEDPATCKHPTYAEVWLQRLRTNFSTVRWSLKYATLEQETATVAFGGVRLVAQRGKLQWGLEEETLLAWKAIAKEDLLNSPRSFFRLVGFLRFAGAILGWPKYVLGRLTKIQSEMGQISNWDDESVADANIRMACEMILSIEEGLLQDRFSHLAKRKAGNPFFAAVDATQKMWAVFKMSEGRYVDVRYGEFGSTTPIDEGESFAMMQGILWALEEDAAAAYMGNDNQIVGYDYEAGYARRRKDKEGRCRCN